MKHRNIEDLFSRDAALFASHIVSSSKFPLQLWAAPRGDRDDSNRETSFSRTGRIIIRWCE